MIVSNMRNEYSKIQDNHNMYRQN